MKKKLIIMGLIASLIISMLPLSQQKVYAESWGDYEYTTDSSDAIITGYHGSDTNVIIPEQIDGYYVSRIASYAFSNRQLTSVTIPNSVSVIENYAFSNNQLTSITLPDNIWYIEEGAFSNNQLTSITFPSMNMISDIGSRAFMNNKLTSIVIPNGINDIRSDSFANNNLTSVILPDYLGAIWDSAFENNKLTSINIPNSVRYIGGNAFKDNQLTSVNIPTSVPIINASAFENNKLTSVTIPDSVTHIGSKAFLNNQLTSVYIPNSVYSISSYAFSQNQLTSVDIPDSVDSIGTYAFTNNPLLSATILSSNTKLNAYAFPKTGKSFTIKGYDPSTAKTLADTNDYNFVNLNAPTNPGGSNPSDDDATDVSINSGSHYYSVNPFMFSSITIDNETSLTSTASSILNVMDSRGSASGWSVSLSATDFISPMLPDPSSNGNGQYSLSIPVSAVSLVTDAPSLKIGQEISSLYGPYASTITLNHTSQKILTSEPGFGMGSYDANLNFTFSVPKEVSISAQSGNQSKFAVGDEVGLTATVYTSTFTFVMAVGI